ncbi:DUF6020 family protein [Priestia megaterium]|uniref:DUF6020 family protein n=2 Tax=Priestia megaterium TaxID=1404 RepID=UPI0011459DEE|nr:DUF6020 family protein [Priestia megaterium]
MKQKMVFSFVCLLTLLITIFGLTLNQTGGLLQTSTFLGALLIIISFIFLYKNRAFLQFTPLFWVLTLIVSFILQFAFFNNLQIAKKDIVSIAFYFFSRTIFTLILNLCIQILAKRSSNFKYQYKNNKLPTFVITLAIFLGCCVYWFGFYPAAMSPDSLAQWKQAHTGEFNDWHPIMVTWILMLIIQLWDSPGAIVLFQILVVSLIYLYTFNFFIKKQIHPILLSFFTLIILTIPPFLVFSVIIWKDILYSSFMLFFTVNIAQVYFSKGSWLKSKKNIFIMFLSAFGVAFFRHNGFPVFILTFLIMAFVFRKNWKIILSILLIIFVAQKIITGPVFAKLDVAPSDPNEALAIPTQQIANIIVSNGKLSAEERDYFNKVFPIPQWKEKYNPYTNDPIKFSWDSYDRNFIFKDIKLYFKNYLSVVIKNPRLATEALLRQTSLVWQVTPFEPHYVVTYITGIHAHNEFGLKNTVISPVLTEKTNQYLKASTDFPFKWIWKPAFYHCIILIFSLMLLVRKGFSSLVILLPWALNTLSVLVALPAQDFRYLLASVFISLFTIALPFVEEKQGERIENTDK